MYQGIRKIEKIIEYIESNLTSEIDYEAMAADMALSVYEFRRIFAFVVGCPLSEYIRKRKLSVAACELMTNPKVSVQQISEKYGYSTLAAFSKAFSEFHGISPSACQKDITEVSLFPRPEFEWNVRQTEKISFRIISDESFAIRGYSALSDYTDSCCCEGVWNSFYESGEDAKLSADTIFVSYHDERGRVRCTIGERTSDTQNDTGACVIPECRWLSVTMNTTDDGIVNNKYNSIISDILPSAKLRRKRNVPTVEVFPADMSSDDFEWEIRIPVEKE